MQFTWLFRLFVIEAFWVLGDEKSIPSRLRSSSAVVAVIVNGGKGVFMLNTTNPLPYCQFGRATDGLGPDPIYMRVDEEGITNLNYTGYQYQLKFCGNLSMGHAWFQVDNVRSQDNGTKFSIYYGEHNGRGPKKMDFKVIIPEVGNSSVASTVTTSNHSKAGNTTAGISPHPTKKPTQINKEENNSYKEHQGTHLQIGLFSAIAFTVTVWIIIGCITNQKAFKLWIQSFWDYMKRHCCDCPRMHDNNAGVPLEL